MSPKGDDLRDPLWVHDDQADIEDQPVDANASLVSLGFIGAAMRRSVRFWGSLAVLGLLLGAGIFLTSPQPIQASTSILLTNPPESVPGTAIVDQQTIAQSRTVAALALRKLGLQEDVSSFLGSYKAAVVTDRVLTLTVNAPSTGDAITRARALATAFLQYRANQLEAQQNLVFGSLEQQVSQAKQQIAALNGQISQVSAQPPSPAQRAKLTNLTGRRDQARTALTALAASVNQTEAATREQTATLVKGSQVLDDAAPVPPSSLKKHLALYAALGLFAGLVLGLVIVVIRALLSERLYRRDDIARALGAPVRLSVGNVRLSRWTPGKAGLAAAQNPHMRRMVGYLRSLVPARSRREAAALAVIPADDPRVAALSFVSLALSFAQQGMKVVLVDLVKDAPAAGLLAASEPGVRQVRAQDANLVVAVPGPDEVVPVGPRRRGSIPNHSAPPRDLVAACASADLVLTLVALDPSLGGDYLATWTDDAVVVISAGKSSWTKIHAIGEMIRLGGTHLTAAILVGAEKTDESLGVIQTPGPGHDAQAIEESLQPEARLGRSAPR